MQFTALSSLQLWFFGDNIEPAKNYKKAERYCRKLDKNLWIQVRYSARTATTRTHMQHRGNNNFDDLRIKIRNGKGEWDYFPLFSGNYSNLRRLYKYPQLRGTAVNQVRENGGQCMKSRRTKIRTKNRMGAGGIFKDQKSLLWMMTIRAIPTLKQCYAYSSDTPVWVNYKGYIVPFLAKEIHGTSSLKKSEYMAHPHPVSKWEPLRSETITEWK